MNSSSVKTILKLPLTEWSKGKNLPFLAKYVCFEFDFNTTEIRFTFHNVITKQQKWTSMESTDRQLYYAIQCWLIQYIQSLLTATEAQHFANSTGFLLLNELSSKFCCWPTRPLKIALHLISRTFCNHTFLLAAFVLHPTIYLKSLATIYSLLVPVPSLLLRPLSGTRYRLNFEMLTQSMFLNLNLKLYFLERPLALSFTVHTYRRIVLDFLL